MKYILLIGLLGACALAPCQDEKLLAQYQRELKQLSETVNNPYTSPAELDSSARLLMDTGTDILMEYRRKREECLEMVDFVVVHQGSMLTMPLENLERVFHDGEGLPEAREHCFNAKEILVHPATVRVLSRAVRDERLSADEARQQMKAEVAELESHFELFQREYRERGIHE